jgi:hypothetical protein
MAPDLIRLRNAGFQLLFDTGRPVPVGELAEHSGYPVDQIETILARPDVSGRVRRNHQGELVGIAGLSVEKTAHEITVGERRFWTWCALDAVGILAAKGSTGRVRSTTPGRANVFEIEFIDGRPVSDHSIFIMGGYEGTDVYESWCPNVNFFETASDAEAWANDAHIEGDVVSIADISSEAAAIWQPVVAPNDAEAS